MFLNRAWARPSGTLFIGVGLGLVCPEIWLLASPAIAAGAALAAAVFLVRTALPLPCAVTGFPEKSNGRRLSRQLRQYARFQVTMFVETAALAAYCALLSRLSGEMPGPPVWYALPVSVMTAFILLQTAVLIQTHLHLAYVEADALLAAHAAAKAETFHKETEISRKRNRIPFSPDSYGKILEDP